MEKDLKNPIDVINLFVDERLDGDVNKLATYELRFLNGDEVYGNPNRYYDSDDTELMRAIYCVVFKEAWPDIETNIKSYNLRGDTLNTFATMFGKVRGDYRPEVHPGLDLHNPSPEIITTVEDFYKICWTMGNMTILPNIFVDNNSINTYRGCHNLWHDFEDRFLMALFVVLTDGNIKDEGLKNLVEANKYFFNPYFGESGWKLFVDRHFLNDYVDDNYKPVISSKGYYYWRNWYMTDEQYFLEVKRYCKFSTRIIKNRAQKMIEIIKDKL